MLHSNFSDWCHVTLRNLEWLEDQQVSAYRNEATQNDRRLEVINRQNITDDCLFILLQRTLKDDLYKRNYDKGHYQNIITVYKLNLLVHRSYTNLILTNIQLFTHSNFIMDTLTIIYSIIKYQQKEFVLVKSFPGYNIARLQAKLDADHVTSFSKIIFHVGSK